MKIEDECKKICKKEREERVKKFFSWLLKTLLSLWIFVTCFTGTEAIMRRVFNTDDAFGITIWATVFALGGFLYIKNQ